MKMPRHVLAYRTEYNGGWTESIGGDDLQWVLTEGESMAAFYDGRQYAVFTPHPPKPWWLSKRRYVFGLTNVQLYIRKYGHRPPFTDGVSRFVSDFDHHVVE